jgi:thioredoxin-like negative regulator of GroEL
LLAREDDAQAARQFERELASAGGRLYAREFSIAAHNGLGLIALKKGDAVDAADRFRQALARYEGHARSHFGLAAALVMLGEKETAERELAAGRAAADALEKAGRTAEFVVASAMGDVLHGLADDACRRLASLLDSAPPGFAGWTIPVEPAFMQLHTRDDFKSLLRLLAERAR